MAALTPALSRKRERVGVRAGLQAQRNLPDGLDVLRDVLADFAIAARRRLDQRAVLVPQVDRQAVELEFGDVFDRRVALLQAQFTPHAGVEVAGAAGLDVGLGANRQHGHLVPHLGEAFQDPAADPLGRRVGRQQVRIGRLQRLQLASVVRPSLRSS